MPLEKLKLQPDKRLVFLQGFLKRPEQVGSVIPSSRFLERRLVQAARVASANVIVELGPGTGGTARALLRAMKPDATLLSIEINPDFVKVLREVTDPRFIVHEGSALQISRALAAHGLPAPDVVLSGIPFSTMPGSLGLRIVQAVYDALAAGGVFVAYQFRDRVANLGNRVFGRAYVEVELLNVPPMRVYRWQKPLG